MKINVSRNENLFKNCQIFHSGVALSPYLGKALKGVFCRSRNGGINSAENPDFGDNSETNISSSAAVVVTQLAEQSFPTPEDSGSNSVYGYC